MEFGEVRAQMKLRATQALIIAVEHATDAVEISNENHEIQVHLETKSRISGNGNKKIISETVSA